MKQYKPHKFVFRLTLNQPTSDNRKDYKIEDVAVQKNWLSGFWNLQE